jgi:hypothetical protein
MAACKHIAGMKIVPPHDVAGCEECLKIGSTWVHLRSCLSCGQVGCCDSSPNKHASKHARAVGHPVAKSLEPGEDWAWCFVDEVLIEPAPGPTG